MGGGEHEGARKHGGEPAETTASTHGHLQLRCATAVDREVVKEMGSTSTALAEQCEASTLEVVARRQPTHFMALRVSHSASARAAIELVQAALQQHHIGLTGEPEQNMRDALHGPWP